MPALPGLLESVLANAVGYGTGSAMQPALAPFVQALANSIWAQFPDMPLDAGIASRLAVRFPGTAGAMRAEAERTGFNGSRFELMQRALEAAPGAGQVLELLRRGEISRADAEQMLRHAELAEPFIAPLLSLERMLLSPADLAMMRQQSFIDAAEHVRRSAEQGVIARDAELLFDISGEPPGPETMIELWRRGLVDEARVRQAVVEGRIKLKYTPDVLALKEVPLSAAVYAEGLLRERIPQARAIAGAAKSGISRDDFLFWSNMLGRPIGTMEAITLLRRGKMTVADVREVVARSDVRTEYLPFILDLKRNLPSLFELRRLIQGGAISDEKAHEIIIDLGYDADLAAGVVDAAHSQKTATHKQLAVTQVLELYQSGMETSAWALTTLGALGYDPPEAQFILDIVEAQRLIVYLRAALARIKSKYVGHKVGEPATLDALAKLGIAGDKAGEYLQLWDVEREANVARLTSGEIRTALKHGVIDKATAMAKWAELNYPREDAEILAGLALAAP